MQFQKNLACLRLVGQQSASLVYPGLITERAEWDALGICGNSRVNIGVDDIDPLSYSKDLRIEKAIRYDRLQPPSRRASHRAFSLYTLGEFSSPSKLNSINIFVA